MRKASWIVLITLLQGALFAISAGVHPQQYESQDDAAWVHNKAKGAWDDSPRITLTFLEMFGDENDDNYLFYEPVAIAADKQGNIYVLDSKNFRVQVFDGDRKFLRSFGRRGQGPGDLGRPECIDLDEAGNVYAADRPLPKEKLIDKDLGLYTTINNALDVDPRGRLWVVTHTRRWKKEELIMRQYVGGQEQVIGDRTETKTDLFEIQVFDSGGVLLQKIPLTHFCDHIKVIGDKVYILDKDRLGQFFVYQIKEM